MDPCLISPLIENGSVPSEGIFPPHPAAEVFPMLPDDELEELAQDILANGLQQPFIVGELDSKSVLIDGRNRREACRRVGIIPNYVLLDGQDPIAYISSLPTSIGAI